jgi:hypothetical protein
MKLHTLITLGALSVGGASLLSVAVAEAHDCCHGRPACPKAGSQAVPPERGGPGTGPMYDPDTVTTLRGTASAVTVMPARGGRMGGMHLTLASDGQTTDVHLGPTWFLQQEGFEVAKGDSVEVTGSVSDAAGDRFLIAREIKKGQKTLKLRDEQGIPAWSGGRRR